jgi:RNA polymerase sigma factor (TIGR02999 family)
MHTNRSDNLGEITLHLRSWSTGSRDAENKLFEAVYPDLRRLAHNLMKREHHGHPLEPTELVNQIYLWLATTKKRPWQNRQHFFAVAVRVMRWRLIDCARARHAAKFVTLDESRDCVRCDRANLELSASVGSLLDQLADANPNWCLVVKLKFFLGLTDKAVAETMGISLRKMQRMWAYARQWLYERAVPEGIVRRQSLGAGCANSGGKGIPPATLARAPGLLRYQVSTPLSSARTGR